MIEYDGTAMRLHIHGIDSFGSLPDIFCGETGHPAICLSHVKSLKISGCAIGSFSFLERFPSLEKLYFLACQSERWEQLSAPAPVASLALHNLRQGRGYLPSLSFLRRFPHLEYVYLNMLGLDAFPDLRDLNALHTVLGSFRNENAVKAPYDFSALEFLPRLTQFAGWMAVDRHRTPAQTLIPVLKNPSLMRFAYTQMYRAEEKKLDALIRQYHPSLLGAALSAGEIQAILRTHFAM